VADSAGRKGVNGRPLRYTTRPDSSHLGLTRSHRHRSSRTGSRMNRGAVRRPVRRGEYVKRRGCLARTTSGPTSSP
jgi:hypothetical protein